MVVPVIVVAPSVQLAVAAEAPLAPFVHDAAVTEHDEMQPASGVAASMVPELVIAPPLPAVST
jgi:hypothetical protein